MKIILTLMLAFLALLPGSRLLAEGNLNASIESQIESAASQILGTNLPIESFQITADVVLDEKKLPKLPLNPAGTQENIIKSMAFDKIMLLPTSVKIKIFLDDTVNTKAKDQIREILTKKLRLDKSRGDDIVFAPLILPTAVVRVKEELSKTDKDLREVRLKLETLQKEIQEKEKTVADLRSENRRNLDKLSTLESGKTAKDPITAKTAEPGFLSQWSPLYLPIAIFAIGLAAIIVFFMGNVRSANIIAGSFSAIAQSIPKLGDKLGSISEGAPQQALMPSSIKEASLPPENGMELKQRLFDLHDQLTSHYDTEIRSFVLQHVTTLLRTNPNSSSAVLLMEFLGKDRANELFELMDAESQSRVLTYMQTRSPEPRKLEMMIRLGEELKTLLILSSMQNSQLNRDTELAVLISRLDEGQRLVVAQALNEAALGRYLSYFPPREVGALLSQSDASSSTPILDALAHLPDYAELAGEDAAIESAIARVTAQSDVKLVRYFSYFKELIESSEESLAKEIQSRLSQPSLKAYLDQNVVTFKMIFEISAETVADLLGRLSVKECAALFKQLTEAQQESLSLSFSSRKRDLIAEEMVFLSEQSSSENERLFTVVKEKIVTDLRRRNKEGSLSRPSAARTLKIAS
ncbi:MAG: hypothetical protein H7249_05730 [Chitinophagaceae bacterium]|nr:hypothetical protein [Oligoflexus sp.]